MASGKQILLHLLNKYSLKFHKKEELEDISEDIRGGFLLHGSTPPDMWRNVENIEWGNKLNEENKVISQGLKVRGKDIMFSDILELIIWDNEVIPKRVAKQFPDLTIDEYKSVTHLIWLLSKSVEYSTWLSEVENNGKLDIEYMERLFISYRKKMKLYRKNPDDFLGIS